MGIKIELHLTNRWLYSLVILFVFLLFVVGTWAYQSNSDPSVFGHSAEELEVSINGQLMTLQQAIDTGVIGKNINSPQYDSGWFDVSTNGGNVGVPYKVNYYGNYKDITYTINHDLGTKNYVYKVFYRADVSSKWYMASDFGCPYNNGWNGRCTGAVATEIGDNFLKIRVGNWIGGLGAYKVGENERSGQHRVLIWKLS